MLKFFSQWLESIGLSNQPSNAVINRAFPSATGHAGFEIATKPRAHAPAAGDAYGEYSAAKPSTRQNGPERASLIIHSPFGYPNPEGGV